MSSFSLFFFFIFLVLDRLQTFLPQMAEANEKLRQQMQEAPDGYFDIERVEEAHKVIEMVGFIRRLDSVFVITERGRLCLYKVCTTISSVFFPSVTDTKWIKMFFSVP